MSKAAIRGLVKLIFFLLFILLVRWANAASYCREGVELVCYEEL